MDNKISVCSLSLAITSLLGAASVVAIATGVIPIRYYGLGHISLCLAIGLYVRREFHRHVAEREAIAFKLGQASQDLERGSLAPVRSIAD